MFMYIYVYMYAYPSVEYLLVSTSMELDPKHHDPEYGLWRGFLVDKCNWLHLTVYGDSETMILPPALPA